MFTHHDDHVIEDLQEEIAELKADRVLLWCLVCVLTIISVLLA